jgi:hypothetical protein
MVFCSILRQNRFLRLGVLSPTPKFKSRRPPFVGCPRLVSQYISYAWTVSSILNLRTLHATSKKYAFNAVVDTTSLHNETIDCFCTRFCHCYGTTDISLRDKVV